MGGLDRRRCGKLDTWCGRLGIRAAGFAAERGVVRTNGEWCADGDPGRERMGDGSARLGRGYWPIERGLRGPVRDLGWDLG